MKLIQTIWYLLLAGALGGLTNSIIVWLLWVLGITPALGFNMTSEWTLEWVTRRVVASAIWGFIFLIPVYKIAPIKKGVLLGILPWLSSVLWVFPMQRDVGLFGLGFGLGTPVWTFLFAAIWGVTGTLFLARFCPDSAMLNKFPADK